MSRTKINAIFYAPFMIYLQFIVLIAVFYIRNLQIITECLVEKCNGDLCLFQRDLTKLFPQRSAFVWGKSTSEVFGNRQNAICAVNRLDDLSDVMENGLSSNSTTYVQRTTLASLVGRPENKISDFV